MLAVIKSGFKKGLTRVHRRPSLRERERERASDGARERELRQRVQSFPLKIRE